MGIARETLGKGYDHGTYTAVREEGRPWFVLEKRGIIAVSGAEAVQFLNGMITNDIAKLEDGSVMLAAFPNSKGRLIAVASVRRESSAFVFDTEEATYETVLANLERFTMAGDFRVDDVSQDFDVIAVRGEHSGEIIGKAFGEEPPGKDRVSSFDFGEAPVVCIPSARPSGFDLRVAVEDSGRIDAALKEAGAVEADPETAELLRIEGGTPRFGIDMNGETVVPETGLEGMISYQKGCYIGQEVIARIHFRGKVAKELKGLLIDGPDAVLSAGNELVSDEGKNAGLVTSSTFSPKLGCHIAMAYVRSAFAESGTELLVNGQACRVTDLPFIA